MKRLLFLICLACMFKAEAQQSSALLLADSLNAAGNYIHAIAAYQEIKPKTESIYLKIARAHQARGTLDEALRNYEMAATGPDQAIALNEYGKLLYSTSHYCQADSVFSLLIDTYDDNSNFYYQRGRIRKKADSYENEPLDSLASMEEQENQSAIADFNRAIQLDSMHQKALYESALYYLQQKDFEKVEGLCEKALKVYPENVKMISLLAQEKFARGFVSSAAEGFEKLLELGQDSQFIHEKLAVCYYKKHLHKQAIERYKIVIARDPQNYKIHENISKLYNIVEDYENAEAHARIALVLKDHPLDSNYYTLGTTYRETRKWKQALDFYNKCLSENDEHREARYYKAVVADNYYKDDEEVLKLYEDFIARHGDTKYAEYDPFIQRAEERKSMLIREIFMTKKPEE